MLGYEGVKHQFWKKIHRMQVKKGFRRMDGCDTKGMVRGRGLNSLCANLRGLNLSLNAEETHERVLSRAEV